MPAFFNGVYGHKPSPRLISNLLKYPPSLGYQEDLVGLGPICRYVNGNFYVFQEIYYKMTLIMLFCLKRLQI
jgi:Asp-tRNA(Asn)/Glu-tRNA(Gln) amidotransferase A subunit family amidase